MTIRTQTQIPTTFWHYFSCDFWFFLFKEPPNAFKTQTRREVKQVHFKFTEGCTAQVQLIKGPVGLPQVGRVFSAHPVGLSTPTCSHHSWMCTGYTVWLPSGPLRWRGGRWRSVPPPGCCPGGAAETSSDRKAGWQTQFLGSLRGVFEAAKDRAGARRALHFWQLIEYFHIQTFISRKRVD